MLAQQSFFFSALFTDKPQMTRSVPEGMNHIYEGIFVKCENLQIIFEYYVIFMNT